MSSLPSCSSTPITGSNIYSVFSFSPPSDQYGGPYYEDSFTEKLNIIIAIIKKAAKIIQTFPQDPLHKKVFVAPEYLFSNYSKIGTKRYYTQEEKNLFKTKLLELSNEIDLIIAPGTFRWWNEKVEGIRKFRNNLYVFYQGKVQHYNKHHPHCNCDFGFNVVDGYNIDHYEFERIFKVGKKAVFQSKREQSPVLEIGGIRIGVEICFDNRNLELRRHLCFNPEIKIDMHLLVSDGVALGTAALPGQPEDFIHIHIERRQDDFDFTRIVSLAATKDKSLLCHHYSYLKDDSEGEFLEVKYGARTQKGISAYIPIDETYPKLKELLDQGRIQEAVREAQEILIKDNTIETLNKIYAIFEERKHNVAGLKVVITLPIEHQRNDVLRPFYENAISSWIRTHHFSPGRNKFLMYFSHALALNGNNDLAKEWINEIGNSKYSRKASLLLLSLTSTL